MSSILFILGGFHEPKIIKKISICQNNPCEILVCTKYHNDSNLESFRDEKL